MSNLCTFFKDILSGQTWILNKFYIKENCIIQCRYICYSIKLIFSVTFLLILKCFVLHFKFQYVRIHVMINKFNENHLPTTYK